MQASTRAARTWLLFLAAHAVRHRTIAIAAASQHILSQRARRFRSAEEAAEAASKAEREGKLVANAADRFDSNCITPGTPFMARLQDHLEHFVMMKLTNDPAWRSITVILDGHEVGVCVCVCVCCLLCHGSTGTGGLLFGMMASQRRETFCAYHSI